MNSNKIISLCAGGLCNRLLPVASCYAFTKLTGRKLVICWEKHDVCNANFEDLFQNNIEIISWNDLKKIKGAYFVGNREDVISNNFSEIISNNNINNNRDLIDLNCPNEIIIHHHNNLIPSIDRNSVIEFLRSLQPITEIEDKINEFTNEFNLDKRVIGMHCRLTDFSVPWSYYESEIQKQLNENPNCKILVCSDDIDFEKYIGEKYKSNVIIYNKKYRMVKKDQSKEWIHNNFVRDTGSVQEAIVDLFLLSKTNIKSGNNHSSFSQTARLLNS